MEMREQLIYIGSDHRGFSLKERLKSRLAGRGYAVRDLGAAEYDSGDDYVDYAQRVCKAVLKRGNGALGVLICGSGQGMDMAANRTRGIRAALCWNADLARWSREREDSNVLCLAGELCTTAKAMSILDAWLSASFKGEERHARRIRKLDRM